MITNPASHYDILGVSPGAHVEVLRRAYRRRAMETHPDRGGSPEAFRSVQTAWENLSDPGRRADYDAALRAGNTEAPATAVRSSDPFAHLVDKASDPDTELPDLWKLAGHLHWPVRSNVADNPSASDDLLSFLSRDENATVARLAAEQLAEREQFTRWSRSVDLLFGALDKIPEGGVDAAMLAAAGVAHVGGTVGRAVHEDAGLRRLADLTRDPGIPRQWSLLLVSVLASLAAWLSTAPVWLAVTIGVLPLAAWPARKLWATALTSWKAAVPLSALMVISPLVPTWTLWIIPWFWLAWCCWWARTWLNGGTSSLRGLLALAALGGTLWVVPMVVFAPKWSSGPFEARQFVAAAAAALTVLSMRVLHAHRARWVTVHHFDGSEERRAVAGGRS